MKPSKVYILGFIFYLYPALAQNVPSWVYSPPKSNLFYYGVGISTRYSDNMESVMYAYENASAYISREIKIEVRSKYAWVSKSGSSESRQLLSTVIDSTIFQSVYDSAMIIDKGFTHNDAFVLIAINKDLTAIKKNPKHYKGSFRKKNTLPKWTNQQPRKKGYYYGVGVCDARNYLRDAWDRSADIARIEIASQINTTHRYLYKDESRTDAITSEFWVEDDVDQTLIGSPIVERYFDAEKRHYYTLIEYKIR